jgi:hypothetical protein
MSRAKSAAYRGKLPKPRMVIGSSVRPDLDRLFE